MVIILHADHTVCSSYYILIILFFFHPVCLSSCMLIIMYAHHRVCSSYAYCITVLCEYSFWSSESGSSDLNLTVCVIMNKLSIKGDIAILHTCMCKYNSQHQHHNANYTTFNSIVNYYNNRD